MKITLEMINEQLREGKMSLNFEEKFLSKESFCTAMDYATKSCVKQKPDDMQYSEEWITRKDGSKLRIVIYKPLEFKDNVPGVMWIHGGAFATGIPELIEPYARMMIKESNCVVVSPDYRLSLEAPYPAAFDDCFDALLWMKENIRELGIREDQIMLGGDSAGASLAVAVSLKARDTGEVNIAFQMPLFPALDDRMESESMKDNNSPVVDSSTIKYMWQVYLGELFEKEVPAYAAPARADDFRGLPPTLSYVGGVDPLRDDMVQYSDNLRKAGVPVYFEVFDGGYHGFETFCPDADISKRAISFFLNIFKYAVENYFAKQ